MLQLLFLLLYLLQGVRFDHDLPFLTLDARLTSIAQARADDMVARDYFSHITPEDYFGRYTPQPEIETAFDYFTPEERKCSRIGELLARNNATKSAETALSGLMESPSHKKLLLRPQYRAIGLGIAHTQGITYYVILLKSD